MQSRRMIPALLVLAALLATSVPTQAQLIVVNREYRVVSVDPGHNVINVSTADGKRDAGNVIVTRDTKLFVFDHPIPNFSWRLLQKGMKITVKGGMTWDLKVKARQIYL